MRFGVLGLISLLISVSWAILLEDAFSKERLNHLINGIQLPHVIDHNSLLGFTNDQFVNLKLHESISVKWSVELNHFSTVPNQLHLNAAKSLVYLYSTSSSTLHAYDIATGVLKRSIVLESYPAAVENFFGDAILVVDIDGNLHRVSNDDGFVQTLAANVPADFEYEQLNGFAYVVFKNKLLKLSLKFELVAETSTSVPAIKQFKDDLLVSSSEVLYRLDDTNFVKIEGKFPLISVVNSNYVISITDTTVEFYHVSDENSVSLSHTIVTKPTATVSLLRYALSDFLVVQNADRSRDVFDLTDYLDVGDSASIKHVKVARDPYSQQQITTSDDGSIVLVTFDAAGSKYSLLDGSFYQFFQPLPQYSSAQNKYYIFDKPASQTVQNKAHHVLEDAKSWVVVEILKRYYTHLGDLGRFVVSYANKPSSETATESDEFGFSKLVVFFDEAKSVLVAVDSQTGLVTWELDLEGTFIDLIDINDRLAVLFDNSLYFVNLASGALESTETLSQSYVGLSKVASGVGHSLVLKTGSNYQVHQQYPAITDIYLVDTTDVSKVTGHKTASGSIESVKTWQFSRTGETILKVISRPQDSVTSSIGISLADRSVLYKYLYPNIITVLSKHELSNSLNLHIIDGVTGSVLYSQGHGDQEVIDYESINLIMDDNWIVYSYFIKSPKVEQRIVVLDLFDTTKSIASDETLQSSFNFNSTIDHVSKKSFIYPERILSLGSTQSSFGITLKSIVAVTQLGNLVEIPKYILNSRRIDDRPLTNDDYLNDYRMLPYDPIIQQNSQAALNHKHKLLVDKQGKILIKPTNLESTSIICYFNKYNQFCSLIQPSSSYDLLSKRFEKLKLISTIAVLLVAYLILKPIVERRKLNEQWIDR